MVGDFKLSGYWGTDWDCFRSFLVGFEFSNSWLSRLFKSNAFGGDTDYSLDFDTVSNY